MIGKLQIFFINNNVQAGPPTNRANGKIYYRIDNLTLLPV